MTDDEIIAVVQAHKEGKKIQFRSHSAPHLDEWWDNETPAWNFEICDYRVAPPKPREWLLHIPKKITSSQTHVLIFPGSEKHLTGPLEDLECVRVREVIE